MFEIPKSEPKITKEFLLSKNSEETYMRTYLKIPVQKGLQISPLRKDRKPTASFYRNSKGDLIFHDFGIGFHENFIGVVMYLYHCDYQKALHIIAEDFGYVDKVSDTPRIKIIQETEVISEKQETLIQIEKRPFTDTELKWWQSFGITAETLHKFKVHACKNVFLNGNYFCSSSPYNPIYGYYGGKLNKSELWRIYFPKKKSFRFISNWNGRMIQGAKQLPKTGELLVITKSLKDCMLLHELGIPAIAPCSEVSFVNKTQLSHLKNRFKQIVVFYDNDYTGVTFLNKIKKKYPDLFYFIIPRKYGVKDISDYCKKYGFNNLKEEVIQWINRLSQHTQTDMSSIILQLKKPAVPVA